MILTLREMGTRCKQFRVDRGYYQSDVARDTGYSVENISSFETGRNDNATILLWYFAHGMTIHYIYGSGYEESRRSCEVKEGRDEQDI